MSANEILVGVASIPQREHALERTVASIAPQADRVDVSLNGYAKIPRFLAKHTNVNAVLRRSDGGDAEKFAAVDDWEGYVVTCDDDLLYPDGYTQTLMENIQTYGRRTAVGFHGGTTLGWNGASKAASHKSIRCLDSQPDDDPDVNVLGTGAMAYHAEGVAVWRSVFRHPNMADVHMACHARTLGIPMVALKHDKGWLTDICPPGSPTIYGSNKTRDRSALDTAATRKRELDRFDWTTPRPGRPRVRVSVATCERPHKLLELLRDLEREARWVDLEVGVYEDPSSADYSKARALCKRNGWGWFRFLDRLGRVRHWKLVDREIRDAMRSQADWFVFTPDDVRLVRHALPKAISTWGRLDSPSTLTLWRLRSMEGLENWTGKRPVESAEAAEIFHVDGLYLCRRDTLRAFGGRCPRPGKFPPSGSGVGRKMSLTLYSVGRRMYRVNESLAVGNDEGVSVMNPDEARWRAYRGVTL